jgi:hypothetical protein
VSVTGRGLSLSFAIAIALVGTPAHSQDLSAGKTPAQLFADGCSACHKSPQGLAKSDGGSLAGFLRQHYTSNPAMADALAGYLAAKGGGNARDRAARPPAAGAAQHAVLPAAATPGARVRGPGAEDGTPADDRPPPPRRRHAPSGAAAPAATPAADVDTTETERASAGQTDSPKRRRRGAGAPRSADEPGRSAGHSAYAPTPQEPGAEPPPILSEEPMTPVHTGHAASRRKLPDDARPDDRSAPKDAAERPGRHTPSRGTTAAREANQPPERGTPSQPVTEPRADHDGADASTGSPSPSSNVDDPTKNKTVKSDAAEEEKTGTRGSAGPTAGRTRRAGSLSGRRHAAPAADVPASDADE